MNIYKNIALTAAVVMATSGISAVSSAQTLGSGAPINFNQILSGKSGSSSSASRSNTISPYVKSSGVGYDLSMNPSTVMQNRARRDAMAQAQSEVTHDYMQQSYLDGEYQKAFEKYQAQFRTNNGSQSKSSTSVVPQNVTVKYNGQKKQRLFVTPKRVFTQY